MELVNKNQSETSCKWTRFIGDLEWERVDVKYPDVKTYYLEMFAHSSRTLPAPEDGLTVRHIQSPSVAYYRSIYDDVGDEYHWRSRRRLSDAKLAAIIHDPLDELYVLHVNDNVAGFAELDRRDGDEIELSQYGLMPAFIGRGLGKWFLQWVVDKAWSYRPRRFWLHTCSLDHPAALPNYLKAGFKLYKETVDPDYRSL